MANYDRDAWRLCTLENTAVEGERLWLDCRRCGRNVYVPVEEFVKTSGLPIQMPHKLVGMRLCCTKCGSRDCFCWAEPYRSPAARGPA